MSGRVVGQDAYLATCVVVAFHRPAALARMLAGLADPRVEVFVVNVEDDPQVAEVAGSRALPFPANAGYAAAVNDGVRAAAGPVVVFVNDDVDIDAAAVLDLAATVSAGEADVVLPGIVDRQGRRQPTIAAVPTPATLFREWFLLPDHPPKFLGGRTLGIEKWRSPAVAERIDAAAATVVAASTELLRRTPLPEAYFLYWEESDWFWRLKAAGVRVLYDPLVVVGHSGGPDDVRPEKSRLLARNAVRCVRLTQGRRSAAMAWVVVILWNTRLVAVDGLRRATGSASAARRLPARVEGFRAAIGAWREV